MDIPPDLFGPDWRVIDKLGEGSFSEVFKVRSVKNQTLYAVKRLKKKYKSAVEVNRLPEIIALRNLQGHANIVKLEEVLYDANYGLIALVFELLDQNLFELIRDNGKPLDEKKSLLLIYQLLKSLAFMHSKNLFHRDIKPENCMVNRNTFEVKLADFGSTRQTFESGPFTEYIATRWYRAPECILTSGYYGPAVDIWAVGCVLFEILTTRPLFPGKQQLDQIARIHNILGTPSRDILAQFRQNPNTNINYVFPHRVPQEFKNLLPHTSPQIVDLLSRLLVYDPGSRITASDALQHPAFELFRRMEAIYKQSKNNVDMPFSLFFLQNTGYDDAFNKDKSDDDADSDDSSESTSINMIQQTILSQNEYELRQASDYRKYQNNVPRQPDGFSDSVRTTSKLADSRRLAAERIKINNEKFKKNNCNNNSAKFVVHSRRAAAHGLLHIVPPRVLKPQDGPLNLTVVPFQKPTAELVKPRITGLKFDNNRLRY